MKGRLVFALAAAACFAISFWVGSCSLSVWAADIPYTLFDLRDGVEILVPAAFAQGAGRVISCESEWKAEAINPVSGARGFLQIASVHQE